MTTTTATTETAADAPDSAATDPDTTTPHATTAPDTDVDHDDNDTPDTPDTPAAPVAPRAEGTALAIHDDRSPGALALRGTQLHWSPEQRAALFQLGLSQAGDADLAVFLHVAQRTGLDPFSRQIYMIKRWDKDIGGYRWTIQTGIDGFRIIADRRNEYRGQTEPQWCGDDGVWRDVWLSPKPPVAARIGVLRADFAMPIYGIALYREYAQTKQNGNLTAMWSGKPAHMIAKCAEALALRKSFPNDLSGIYTEDEMARFDTADDDGSDGPVVVDGGLVDELTGRAPAAPAPTQAPKQATATRDDRPAPGAPEGDPFARFVAEVTAADKNGTTREGINDLWNRGTRNPGWLDRSVSDGDDTSIRSVLIRVFKQVGSQTARADAGDGGEE